ncbi:clostripain-related cysteine peptidase [uncultured Alistipes sp.]|uniref:clostripain-related cysteine peptidase n=1 Tax=uncultured Alistipes sp. TaxID=538949 RepID=UPI00259BBF29|nr:clostripain-related cysteine peptidase [uncultured Alistipes sp.]
MMKTTIRYILLFALLALAACTKDDAPRYPHASRVVLVYMAGDNSLGGYVWDNLDAMRQGMASAPAGSRTIAYVDTPDGNPRLLEVTSSGTQTLYTWPSAHNSASAATVREAIGRVRTLAPADRYGLVLWSHGLAWMPSWATGYLTCSKARMAEPWPQTKHEEIFPASFASAARPDSVPVSVTATGSAPTDRPFQAFPVPTSWPATKWFGQDTGENPAGYLDVEQLSEAIPSGVFDWMLFDACFMASAETLYALRDKAERIVCSPAEVIADGFPYAEIMAELLRPEPDLRAVCETYYRNYADDPRPAYRSATVSLVETSQLEALAAATASVLGAALATDPEVLSVMDLNRVQPLDRYRRHFLFDMGSVVGELETRGLVPALLAEAWRAQLARTVIYEAHTPTMLGLALDACCGLSMYVPYADYADLNEYYRSLGWYAGCYPADYNIAQ